MVKISLRTPIILGLSWFLIAFISSELSYRMADLVYEEELETSDFLYELSDRIAWPASILYSMKRKQLNKDNLLDLRDKLIGSEGDTATIDFYLEVINSEGDEGHQEIFDYLESEGYNSFLPTLDEYLVYGVACFLSGAIVGLFSFILINFYHYFHNSRGIKMELSDSKTIKNHVKVRSVITALVVHAYLAVFTVGISLVLLLIIGLITTSICRKEIDEAASNSNKFNKNYPFRYFGQPFGDFQHVFHHLENLEKKLHEAIENGLKSNTPIKTLEMVALTDIDKNLSSFEERKFIKAESGATTRGTTVTLILNQSSYGSMRSIQWRVLVGGYIDRDKKFNLIAYSIFTFFFWIVPYVKREHDLLSRVRTIYPGSYNDMDVVTQVRCLHQAVFDAMIEEFEKNNIDTTDLKAQKMQVMNINISGGKVNMGNIVQGAMNKVTSVAKGNRS